MNCNCEKAPEFPTKAFIPGPIEIPINFRAVTIPADQGDDTTNPPLNGAYRNVVLKYAANNHTYIYSSDGIPVMLVGGVDFDDIVNRPLYDGEPMTSDTNIPDLTDEVETLEAQIQALATDFSYKGSVEDYAHLPSDAATGDVYTTTDTGIIYVWDGNAWVALNEYPSVFTGATSSTAGTSGLVPAPTTADVAKFLSGDGTWKNTTAFLPFPSSVNTSGTTQQFLNSILALNAPVGTAFLGTVSLSDMPDGLIQEEVEVYIYSDYVAYAIMRSTDVDPYQWWCASYNYQGWQPVGSGGGATLFYISDQSSWATSSQVPLYAEKTLTNPIAKPQFMDAAKQGPITLVVVATQDAPTDYYNWDYYTVLFNEDDSMSESLGSLHFNVMGHSSIIRFTWDQTTDPVVTGSFSFPNIVQTPGNSTTNVMSQDATTKLVFKDPTTRKHVKIGDNAYTGSLAANAIAIGDKILADGSSGNAIAIGFGNSSFQASANGANSIAIGFSSSYNLETGNSSVAIGDGAYAGYPNNIAIGRHVTTNAQDAIAIGNDTMSKAKNAIAIGASVNNSLYYGSIAIGGGSLASAEASIAIGGGNGTNYRATVTGKGAVAIGASSQATQQGEFNIGAARTEVGYNNTNYRLLTGVHDPQAAHDAATKGYVDTAVAGAGGATINSTDWSNLWQ